MSLEELQDRLNEICAKANQAGASVILQVARKKGIEVVIKGRNVKGEELEHPFECGCLEMREDALGNDEFIGEFLSAVEKTLFGEKLTDKEKATLPPSHEDIIGAILGSLPIGRFGGIGIVVISRVKTDD
ncbi:MAG: hypothetical protein QY314_01640 [Candidatus Dojkabacteria bacterium]|nr:MAG: hypothetical protein QY314_01640 [Candidatus Dojkabacteria bacterium]